MKSIIENLYDKKKGLRDNIKPSKKYSEINKKYLDIYEELEKCLNEEQKRAFFDMIVTLNDREGELACTHFKEGFKLGMLVAVEVFSD